MLLARARTKSPFRRALLDGTTWHVRLTTTVTEPLSHTVGVNKVEILIPPISVATNATLFQRPRFISENNNDGHFYEALTYNLIEVDDYFKRSFSTVRLKFELLQGGGNTTGDVYANEKASKRSFCLAVVDSDQEYPDGPFGQTAKRIVAVDRSPNSSEWNARALVLKVRAVENLFPIRDLQRAATALDASLGEKTTNIVKCHGGRPHWNFLHLKEGVKCFDIRESISHEARFLREVTAFGLCPNFSHEPCQNRELCETNVIEPLGKKLLSALCDSNKIKLQLNVALDTLALPSIKELGIEMISAFCGDEPVLGSS